MRTHRVGVSAGRWLLCALATLALSACGGGGGSSGSSGSSGTSGSGTAATYSIGGSISGLSASGLVLTDNGTDNLAVASNKSSFTFSTRLASGASYDVAVASQPSGENCLVTSGASGTVSGNVSTVTVNCSGSGYTVSGTLTDLQTAGLKLTDYSGGQTLAVAAGATSFAFTQSVMYGTDVDVTVNTQPFWATCTAGASNYTGPITANLTSDTFSCALDSATVTTFAGSTTAGNADGTGTAASFHGPSGVAMDSAGNLYVADTLNNEIREITPAGLVTTLAGTGTSGATNGSGTVATFNGPAGIAVNAAGDIFVADSGNNEIREIVCTSPTAASCTVSLLAGSITPGNTDGLGTQATFEFPEGVTVDSAGNLYVADTQNDEIREIVCTSSAPSASTCTVSTLAGSTGNPGDVNGSGTSATFDAPTGVAVAASGEIYVADQGNNEIREIVCTSPTAASCTVSLLAGSTTAGSADGTGTAASFDQPTGISVDSGGDLYVADMGNDEIRLVTPQGVVTTLAGSTTAGSQNGTGSAASFNSPTGIAVAPGGTLFVGDYGNNEIREVAPQ